MTYRKHFLKRKCDINSNLLSKKYSIINYVFNSMAKQNHCKSLHIIRQINFDGLPFLGMSLWNATQWLKLEFTYYL